MNTISHPNSNQVVLELSVNNIIFEFNTKEQAVYTIETPDFTRELVTKEELRNFLLALYDIYALMPTPPFESFKL